MLQEDYMSMSIVSLGKSTKEDLLQLTDSCMCE